MFPLVRLLVLATPVATVGGLLASWAGGLPSPTATGFTVLLTELAAWTVVGGCVWTLGLLGAAAIEACTRQAMQATRLIPAPQAARRWALALVGIAVVSAGQIPAYAEQGGAPPPHAAVAGLPVPDRPDGSVLRDAAGGAPRPATRPERRTHLGSRVVVRPGDSLWHLVAVRLPRSADERTVAATVSATYRANRRAIGPDPDLIRPGQQLVVQPRPHHHHPEEDR